MGAYLSTPVTEKISINRETKKLKYGASSMQGWRVAQEDAHSCCPDYDEETDTSLFAVYDGHGGPEVAAYAASNLPKFLKDLPSYKTGKLAQALEDAFLGFDEKLTRPEVIKELKELAGMPSDDNKEEGEEDEEPGLLVQEATMPLEQLLEKYGGAGSGKIRSLRKQDKFNSPVIKPKTVDENTEKLVKKELENTTNDPVKKSLEEEMINGVSENENNENKEKEQAQSEANSCTESKSECKDTETKTECDSKDTTSNGSDVGCAMMPDSSTDNSKPKLSGESKQETESKLDTVTSGGSNANAVTSQSSCGSSESVCSSGSAGSSSGFASADVGSSSGSGSSSGCEAGGSSNAEAGGSSLEQTAEAGSSSGRTRKSAGSGLLADDEDSTDDSEDSDVELDSDEDIDALVEPDSEDDSDDLEMEEEEDLEEDLEEDDDILGGREEPGSDSGTTAVLALLRGKDLHVANAGDSRCVLCRNGKAVDMSEDHKPEDDIEQARIMTAGGRVTPDGRVNGGLNLSRALGDHCYKRNEELPLRDQMITPLPDVKSVVLTEEDEFMVLACDGIWNVMTSQDVTNFVRERIQSGVDQLSVICEEMFDFCLAPDTNGDGTGCDNMTCMIIKFNFNTNDHQTASVKRHHSDSTEPETVKKPKTDT